MYTDVYVALDYPSKETHWEGYNKIREYLKGEFPEFASFNVIAREANYGSARNMRELRNDILKKYDHDSIANVYTRIYVTLDISD